MLGVAENRIKTLTCTGKACSHSECSWQRERVSIAAARDSCSLSIVFLAERGPLEMQSGLKALVKFEMSNY